MNSLADIVVKACPHCGSTTDAPIESCVHVSMSEHDWRAPSWSVQCDNCTATNGLFDCEDDAIDNWNARTDPLATLVLEVREKGAALMRELVWVNEQLDLMPDDYAEAHAQFRATLAKLESL